MARSGMPLDTASRIARWSVDTILKHYRAFSVSELQESMETMKKVRVARRAVENASLSGDLIVTMIFQNHRKTRGSTLEGQKESPLQALVLRGAYMLRSRDLNPGPSD